MRRFRLLLVAIAGVVVFQTTASAALAIMTALPRRAVVRDAAVPALAVIRLARGRRRMVVALRAPMLLPSVAPLRAAAGPSRLTASDVPSYHSADSPPPDHPPA